MLTSSVRGLLEIHSSFRQAREITDHSVRETWRPLLLARSAQSDLGSLEAEFAISRWSTTSTSLFRLEGPEKLFSNRTCQHRKCSLEFCRAPIGSYIYSALLPAETVHVFVGSFSVDRGKGRADEWILVRIGCCQKASWP